MKSIREITNKYIKENEIFSRFIKVFSVDVLVRGANFLLIPVFLRLMTPEEYGLYGYLYSFASTLSSILCFGFYVALIKLYADTVSDKDKQGSMLYTLTTSLFLLVILSIIIVYFWRIDVDFFSFLNKTNSVGTNQYSTYRDFVFVATASMIFSTYLTFFLVSSERIKGLQTFNLLRFFLTNITAILVIYFSDGDNVFQRLAVTYLMELILTICFSGVIYKNFVFKFSSFFLKKAFKLGLPIMASGIMYAIVNFGDKFFVAKYAGEEGMAIYYLGYLLATIVLIIYQSFNFVWNPLFMKEKDLTVLRRKTNRYLWLIAFGLGFIGILIWIGAYIGLKINLIPQDYYLILHILPFLIISQVLSSMAQLMINYMTYFEKTYIQVFLGGFLSLIGYYLYNFMGEKLGVMGISISIMFINTIFFLFFYYRSQYYINNRLKE
ncbi:MAG: lipopolysaccharide biosynthesis protein [Bacteroidetes bacterium]|nr:lipopolysaccharide biosynthesis protein [Bacteroidota bacterium]